MVNVIENRALVELVPLTPSAPGPSAEWRVCQVRVETAEDVQSYPNLFGDLPRAYEALVPTAIAEQLAATARWRVEASLVGPGRMRVEAVP